MVSKSGCVGWLRNRTNLEKTLLSLSSLLFLTLIIMILIGITYDGKKSGNSWDEDEVCWSSDCIKAARDVLSSMRSTVDSCTDFYNFACGNYGQEPGQTASVSKRSTESVFFTLKNILESDDRFSVHGLDEVKHFYKSCVRFGSYRQEAIKTGEDLLNLTKDLGIIWPIIDSQYEFTTYSWEKTLARLILLDAPVVFKMEVVPDERSPNSYLVKISPGGPRETGRTPLEIREDVHLRSSILTSFLLVGASNVANTYVNDILFMESSFANIEQDKNTPCDDVTLLLPPEATKELNRLMPEIEWDVVFSEIQKATGLRRSVGVELHCKRKIRDYAVHLKDQADILQTNYLGWRFFSKYVEHMIPTFEKSHFLTGEVMPRWRVCLELMEKFAAPVLADVLTHKMIDNEIKEKVERISRTTVASAQRLVSRASWLSDPRRSRIREKVSQIRIRYPFLKQDVNGLVPLRIPQVNVTNFTAVVIQRQRQRMIEEFMKLNQDTEATDAPKPWMPVLSARSNFLPSDTAAYIYFDKITSPYIRRHGSEWLHFGGFGVSIAKEISRILMFMNTGRRDEGESTKLWNVWLHSKNSSACLNRSLRPLLGHSDMIITSEEREKLLKDVFLEQSALEIAYETAVTLESSQSSALPGLEFGGEKLFFLSYAQTLCNPDSSTRISEDISIQDRVNAVVSNSGAFEKVFNCETSSPSCLIWA